MNKFPLSEWRARAIAGDAPTLRADFACTHARTRILFRDAALVRCLADVADSMRQYKTSKRMSEWTRVFWCRSLLRHDVSLPVRGRVCLLIAAVGRCCRRGRCHERESCSRYARFKSATVVLPPALLAYYVKLAYFYSAHVHETMYYIFHIQNITHCKLTSREWHNHILPIVLFTNNWQLTCMYTCM